MPAEDLQPESLSDTPAEPTQANPLENAAENPSDTSTLPAPALNREQRRAQAKGKKGATPGFNPTANHAGNRFGGGRPANAPIQNKIPRTGHK